MCPNGVEWKQLGEVCNTFMGEFVHKNKQNPNGLYPVYNGGTTPTGFYDEYNATANKVIISARGAGAGYVNRVETNFWAGNSCHVLEITNPNLDWRFLYYILKNQESEMMNHQQKGGGVPAISKKQINEIEIPLPPLEIQKKIVECLDKFSALAAELQAELQMRRKQYEYYRTQLLTPHSDGNSADNTDDRNWGCQRYTKGIAKVYDWQWKTLGEVCEINRGVRVVRNELGQEGKYPVYQNSLTPLGYYNKCNYPANTTFIISAGAAGKVGFSDIDFWAADDCLCIKCPETINSKYLYYYMLDKQDFFLSQVRHASVPRMSRTIVENFKLLIPSLEEQERIVSILDKFEALTTSLSDGIPAEQAAQQKRYEYYRYLLLTFDRKAE